MNLRDRQILNIALPSIVSNITVPLLGLMDVAIVGHLGSAAYIGAISIGSMVFNVMYWLFGFLRMGSSGLTSQALGRRDLPGVVHLLQQGLRIAFIISLAILILGWPLRWLSAWVMQPSAEVLPLFHTYFFICLWGAPASLALYSLSGWFIGMQNSRTPMAVAITQNVVNICVSLLLVVVCGMKVEGVALGTLVAQWSGFLMAAALCWRHYRRIIRRYGGARRWFRFPSFSHERRHPALSASSFFRINRDIFLRTLCLASVMLFFTSAGSRSGDLTLAANTILMQFYLIFSYIMDGFAYAGEALSGRFKGAGNQRGQQETVSRLFRWGFAITVGFTLLYALGGLPFVRCLTNSPDVVSSTAVYLPWAIAVPVAGVAAFIWDGIFIGLTASRGMLISSFAATVAFFCLYALLFPVWGNHGLWLAFIVYLIMRGSVQWWLYRSHKL